MYVLHHKDEKNGTRATQFAIIISFIKKNSKGLIEKLNEDVGILSSYPQYFQLPTLSINQYTFSTSSFKYYNDHYSGSDRLSSSGITRIQGYYLA